MTLSTSSRAEPACSRRDLLQLGIGATALTVGALGVEASQYESVDEPTAEFKAAEAKNAEFGKGMKLYQADFSKSLGQLQDAKTDADAIKALQQMTALVLKEGQLPTGLKKEALFKTVRTKKAAMANSGKWSVDVQIVYDDLKREVMKTTRPDTTRL
ncbi:unnamed protein product [Chrysoparadoxa australica]